MAKDLTCRELATLLTDYLEGALHEGEVQRFHLHLAECEGCANHLEQMRITIRVTRQVTVESIDPEVRQRLLQAFRGWKPR